MTRRVVITGLGTVVPGGDDVQQFWKLLTSGTTATRRITRFDPSPFRSQSAGECDFDPGAHGLTARDERRMDRAAQLAVASTREAVRDAGLDTDRLDPSRVGVSIGSAVGATTSLEDEYLVLSDTGRLWELESDYATPHLYNYLVPSSIAAEVAWAVGAEGPTALISAGCTSGLDAIGYGRDLIVDGTADIVIAGGSDAPISPLAVACFDAIKATSPRNDDPEHASRPFDSTRNGFVVAEGAATLVLEEYEHARTRGATIYAEVRGHASRCNAYHMTGLRPDGVEMSHAIDAALAESKIDPSGIDYVNAHGSGTKQNDRHETAAFKRSLGHHAYKTPVSSIKSMIGHSLGAIGAIELVACALSIEHSTIPPTANLTSPDPELDLDYVPLEARAARVDVALSVGSGFGGFQSAVVLSKIGVAA
ncbi:beta-ketoacyl-[acyl-carrier-protein] synthase family protein [Rhodococcus jostii]|uniref:Beta-ketoacyl-[acyl-carrier-protein] synthase family protein n=1 Tax=Rhodococcus jostii TaxID=132919 RepID=A0ABU4CT81_RHOJO|nr:beta-ketoacyl-[acyl-carrier-protein] synthase family protein [Rhodococcus jostii]MDV6286786.1 beta-ketoacyl-[acyl-carrier-protein] synthase family protein [Rhodococcus jostii]